MSKFYFRLQPLSCFLFGALSAISTCVHVNATPYETADAVTASRFMHLPIPLPKGTQTTIRQGAFGESSHREIGNEYQWDFEVPLGTPVLAVGDGAIIDVFQTSVGGCDPKYSDRASNLKIELKNGSVAQYLHIETTLSAGSQVGKGQVIAHTAVNGWLCYPHLHFGVYASASQLYSSPQRKSIPIFFDGIPDGIAREGRRYVVP